jgi:hypothetical protein
VIPFLRCLILSQASHKRAQVTCFIVLNLGLGKEGGGLQRTAWLNFPHLNGLFNHSQYFILFFLKIFINTRQTFNTFIETRQLIIVVLFQYPVAIGCYVR